MMFKRSKPSKMTPWNMEQDKILIEFVRNQEILYNIKSKDFRKIQLKQSLWCEIGKILNKTDFDCSKRWAYVRDYYIRRKCKIGTNRSGSSGEAAKKRADLLSFLDSFTLTQRHRLPKDDDENTGEHSETMEYPEVNIERTQSHYQTPTEMIYDEDETNTQESNNSDDVTNNTVSKEYCKKLKSNSHSQEQKPVQNELDEIDLFFQSMAKIVKRLPRYEQAHLRMQIGSLIGNAELSYISNNLYQNRDFSRRPGASGFLVPSSSASEIPDVVPSPEAGSSAVNDQGQNIFHFSFKQEEI